MKFPIVVIKEKEAPLYYFNSNTFGLVSKGGQSFYQKGIAFDSEGNKFLIEGIGDVRRAGLINSVRYFQPMFMVDVNVKVIQTISLEEFKHLLFAHFKRYASYWTKKDLIKSLEKSIEKMNCFEEIIEFIR